MPPSSSELLKKIVATQKIVICCGSGGVGKTTTAAVLGLYAAWQGRKTLVLTIDPAKRLANALGLEGIDYAERLIPTAALSAAGLKLKAPLYAMMLDTKRTFDQLILKHAASPEKAEQILKNPLYQQLSNMIAGSQEYMAMEKLYEIAEAGTYDLIVLDTPPSRHALDFLDAPNKMSSLIGDSILKWFLKPSVFVGRAGLKLLDRPMRRVFKSLNQVAGFEFLQDLSVMLINTADLLDGFKERAQQVSALLHESSTSFILVAAPQTIPLQEARFFYDKILSGKLPFGGFIFNRVHQMPTDPGASGSGQAQKDYLKVLELFEKLADRDADALKEFKRELKLDTQKYFSQQVPELKNDVHHLQSLAEVMGYLFEEA